MSFITYAVLSQSGEFSPDFCCGGGIRHNEDIMHSFQNFIVQFIPNHPPPLETRIWKLVVRALNLCETRGDEFQEEWLDTTEVTADESFDFGSQVDTIVQEIREALTEHFKTH